MTARQVWEGMLTELNKVGAPSMLLSDFNYYFNKAIYQYINKRYANVDISQQQFDDLRVLKAQSFLTPTKVSYPNDAANYNQGYAKLLGATYEITMPEDYYHMLNLICIYKLAKDYKCYDAGNYAQYAATPLGSATWGAIINNYYQRPLPQRPYYTLINVNTETNIPTNPVQDSNGDATTSVDSDFAGGTDIAADYKVSVVQDENGYTTGTVNSNGNFPRTIKLNETVQDIYNNTDIDAVNRQTAWRYGNASRVKVQIRYGYDDSVFVLDQVLCDYIKTPQHIRLTQEQVNLTEDTSQIMEFPDYVCQEIINELTLLVLEHDNAYLTNNARDLTQHAAITNSVDAPQVQALALQIAQQIAKTQTGKQ